jgi:hypothetical protein
VSPQLHDTRIRPVAVGFLNHYIEWPVEMHCKAPFCEFL